MNDIDSMYEGDIPVGGWRDRISDPLVHGVCHPILWTTVFCPLCKFTRVAFISVFWFVSHLNVFFRPSDTGSGHDSSKV